jgi:hypothetical protein
MATRSILKAEQKLYISSSSEVVPIVENVDSNQGRLSQVLLLSSRKRIRRDSTTSARNLLQRIASNEASALSRASERRLASIQARHEEAQSFDSKRVYAAKEDMKAQNAERNNITTTTSDSVINGVTSSLFTLESSSSSSSSSSLLYRGKPLHGSTSGALYLGAEHISGFPSIKRDEFVYPIELTKDAFSGNVGGSGNTSSSALAEAKEILKRPSFPSKNYQIFVGNVFFRKLAIAKDFDDVTAHESYQISDTKKAINLLRR